MTFGNRVFYDEYGQMYDEAELIAFDNFALYAISQSWYIKDGDQWYQVWGDYFENCVACTPPFLDEKGNVIARSNDAFKIDMGDGDLIPW